MQKAEFGTEIAHHPGVYVVFPQITPNKPFKLCLLQENTSAFEVHLSAAFAGLLCTFCAFLLGDWTA
jgi:hypothetical protein